MLQFCLALYLNSVTGFTLGLDLQARQKALKVRVKIITRLTTLQRRIAPARHQSRIGFPFSC